MSDSLYHGSHKYKTKDDLTLNYIIAKTNIHPRLRFYIKEAQLNFTNKHYI